MDKLKPCPFCGGKAEIVTNGELTTSKSYFADVLCKNTNCRGWSSCLESKTKQQAIKYWNKRAVYTEEIDFDYEAEDGR